MADEDDDSLGYWLFMAALLVAVLLRAIGLSSPIPLHRIATR